MFLISSRTTLSIVRDAMGDYHRDWWKPIAEGASVILLTFVLSKRFSFYSIPLSISITLLSLSLPVDNYIVSRRLRGKVDLSFVLFFIFVLILSALLLIMGLGL